jgi:hypothetical protein
MQHMGWAGHGQGCVWALMAMTCALYELGNTSALLPWATLLWAGLAVFWTSHGLGWP